eukprot:Hpha_TRINITY_DN29793_c0_g1::TRINITY_DN29793_c0_g1_i1::g.2596::m.2596
MLAQPVLFLCAVSGGPAAHTASPLPPATGAPTMTPAPSVPLGPTTTPTTSLPTASPSTSPQAPPTVLPFPPTVTLWMGCNVSELVMPDTYARVSGDGCAGDRLVPPEGACEVKLVGEVCDSPRCSAMGDGTWDYTDPLCVHYNHPVTTYVDFVVGVAVGDLDLPMRNKLASALSKAVDLPDGSASAKGIQVVPRDMVSSLVRIPVQDTLGQSSMTPRMFAKHAGEKLLNDTQSPNGHLQAAGFIVEGGTLHSRPAGLSETPVPTDASNWGGKVTPAPPGEADDSSDPLLLVIVVAASLIFCTFCLLYLALQRRQRRGIERLRREQEKDSTRRQAEEKDRRRSLAISLVESPPSSPKLGLGKTVDNGGEYIADESMVSVTAPLGLDTRNDSVVSYRSERGRGKQASRVLDDSSRSLRVAEGTLRSLRTQSGDSASAFGGPASNSSPRLPDDSIPIGAGLGSAVTRPRFRDDSTRSLGSVPGLPAFGSSGGNIRASREARSPRFEEGTPRRSLGAGGFGSGIGVPRGRGAGSPMSKRSSFRPSEMPLRSSVRRPSRVPASPTGTSPTLTTTQAAGSASAQPPEPEGWMKYNSK